MRLRDRASDEELKAIVQSGATVRPAPDVVRARMLARARAAILSAELPPDVSATMVIPPSTRGWRIALAAALVLGLASAGAAALLARSRRSAAIEPMMARSPEAPPAQGSVQAPPETAPASPSIPGPARIRRPVSPQESYAAELQLLQRAQSRYTSQHFQDALILLAEHSRRFPNGRLAEEREALRVKSLASAGRGNEARHALAGFAKHFPHSALLPRLEEAARTADE